MNREVYLDNSATTRPFDDILEEVGQTVGNSYGNPSSLHNKGLDSEKILKDARSKVANSLGVNSGEIFFTSGGTESNNIAILGAVRANEKRLGTIITSMIEHSSVLGVFRYLEKQGHKVKYLPVDKDGIISLEILEKYIQTDKVTLVSIMHVNNEVGAVQPLEELIRLKRRYEFILHVDAVQSYCKLPLQNICKDINLISVSGHKINAFKGIGVLYIKKGTRLEPVFHGGGQENYIKPGTENVPGVWSLGRAVDINLSGKYGHFSKVRDLKNYFILRVMEEVQGAALNGTMDKYKSAPHIANISFEGIPGEVMLHALEERGIYVSTGSACSSRKRELSHVLISMGIDRELIKSSVRFSFSVNNNKDEVDYCLEAIKENVKLLAKE